MAASSSTRASGSRRVSEESVWPSRCCLATRRWSVASDAICGRWVMQSTCTLRLMRRMSCPMRPAMVPLTPVSISSKTTVGRLRRPATRVLRASMRRAISPPEAVSARSRGGMPGLAEKRKATVSVPPASGAVRGRKSKQICVSGMPSWTRSARRVSAISRAASRRLAVSSAPAARVSARVRSRARWASARCSSAWSMASRRARNSSATRWSSATLSTLCLRSRA